MFKKVNWTLAEWFLAKFQTVTSVSYTDLCDLHIKIKFKIPTLARAIRLCCFFSCNFRVLLLLFVFFCSSCCRSRCYITVNLSVIVGIFCCYYCGWYFYFYSKLFLLLSLLLLRLFFGILTVTDVILIILVIVVIAIVCCYHCNWCGYY